MAASLATSAGCAICPAACDETVISPQLDARTGFGLGPFACPGEVVFPNGATPADGLAEDEAVLIALWNDACSMSKRPSSELHRSKNISWLPCNNRGSLTTKDV